MEKELNATLKKLKTEKLQALTKYILKYGCLTTYFFDYGTLYMNETLYWNGQKIASSSFSGKVTSKSLRTKEA